MNLQTMLTQLAEQAGGVLASPTQLVAYLAAGFGILFMVAGAVTRTMLPLRWLAVGGNLGLMLFGVLKPSPLTMLVSAALLPVNLYRAIEITLLVRRVQRARVGADMASIWLRPHMRLRQFKSGHVLFRKGERASDLFLLVEGELEMAEIGKPIEAGRIFGEIALFSKDQTRTQTVRCLSACSVLQINATTVRELFFQNPAFAFHLMELLAQRLRSDIVRANAEAPPVRADTDLR